MTWKIKQDMFQPEIIVPTLLTPSASATDVAAGLCTLRTEVFREEFVAAGVPETAVQAHTKNWAKQPDEFAVAVQKKLDNPMGYVRAVVLGKAIVGYFVGQIAPDVQRKELAVIQLAPEVRGQHLGKHLIRGFEMFSPHSPQESTLPIELNVLQNNQNARGFYESQGFTEKEGDAPEPFDIAGIPVSIVRMVKTFDR
jgi:ribosomal protein S18 acetylase RimI-like enzyme